MAHVKAEHIATQLNDRDYCVNVIEYTYTNEDSFSEVTGVYVVCY